MSTTETTMQLQEKNNYLTDLVDQIKSYVYVPENSSVKDLRFSMIESLLKILQNYGLSANQIYREYPDTLSVLFTNDEPDHRIRDLLLAQGFDVNTKTKEGKSPLWEACEAGNAAVARYLLHHGANANSAFNGHTPPGVASAHPEFDISAMNSDPDCKAFMEQYYLIQNTMMLAHRWSISGSGQLGNDKFDAFTYTHPTVLRESLTRFFVTTSEKNKAALLELCKKISPNLNVADIDQLIANIAARFRSAHEPDLKELSDKIEAGETCPISVGTIFPEGGRHHEGILFFDKNKFIRVNRGEGSDGRTGVEINTITKPENIPAFLEDFSPSHMEAATLHAALEEQLGLEKIRLIQMKDQVSPTCKWLSEKGLFYGVIYSELLSLFKTKGVEEKIADEAALGITKSWYKNITKKDRLEMVNTILNMFPNKTISEMPLMIKEMLYKIYDKSVTKEKYLPVVKMLEERGMKTYYDLNQQFVEAVKKENEETLLGYIERGVVGNQCVDYVDSVLAIMIERGFHKAAKALLESGTSANPVHPAYKSILYTAMKKNDLEMIDLLLQHGAYASHLHLRDIAEIRAKSTTPAITASGERGSELSHTPVVTLYQAELAKAKATLVNPADVPAAATTADTHENDTGPKVNAEVPIVTTITVTPSLLKP